MECPKCYSKSASFYEDHTGVFLKCFCGNLKLLQSKYKDGSAIDHIDIDEEISLPRKGTKLLLAVGALYSLEPATTKDITELVNTGEVLQQSTSDVASQLTILRYKGLVSVTDYKRGIVGGSTWVTTDACKKLMCR
jgi:hypothetical protein